MREGKKSILKSRPRIEIVYAYNTARLDVYDIILFVRPQIQITTNLGGKLSCMTHRVLEVCGPTSEFFGKKHTHINKYVYTYICVQDENPGTVAVFFLGFRFYDAPAS